MSFKAEDLAALTEALIGRTTLTDDGFLYASFRQVEAPDTWTADAAYPADSPIPYTLTAKAETLLGRPAPRRPPCEQCTLVVCEHVLHKPDLASPASQAPTPPRSPLPPFDSGILRLHARMKEPEPEPEAGL